MATTQIQSLDEIQVGTLVYIWNNDIRSRQRVTEVTSRYFVAGGYRFGRHTGKGLDISRLYIGTGAGERF